MRKPVKEFENVELSIISAYICSRKQLKGISYLSTQLTLLSFQFLNPLGKKCLHNNVICHYIPYTGDFGLGSRIDMYMAHIQETSYSNWQPNHDN